MNVARTRELRCGTKNVNEAGFEIDEIRAILERSPIHRVIARHGKFGRGDLTATGQRYRDPRGVCRWWCRVGRTASCEKSTHRSKRDEKANVDHERNGRPAVRIEHEFSGHRLKLRLHPAPIPGPDPDPLCLRSRLSESN